MTTSVIFCLLVGDPLNLYHPSLLSGTVDDWTPSLYEQSINIVVCALGGSIRKIFFMLVSYDRRARQAGLMVIAANAEGTSNDKLNVLDNIVRFLPEAILLSG